jgi:hypothetical protein
VHPGVLLRVATLLAAVTRAAADRVATAARSSRVVAVASNTRCCYQCLPAAYDRNRDMSAAHGGRRYGVVSGLIWYTS